MSELPLIQIRPDLTVGAAVTDDDGRRTIHTAPNTRLTPEVVDLINDTHHHRMDQALTDHGVIDPRQPPDDEAASEDQHRADELGAACSTAPHDPEPDQ